MSTLKFKDIYIESYGCSAGPLEGEGPLSKDIDFICNDIYFDEKSYEKAERMFTKKAIDVALRRNNIKMDDIKLVIGSDLMNQLSTSNYIAPILDSPFFAVYGACSNCALSIGIACKFISKDFNKILAFTSSHNCTAERQFRYPNEYGVQKKCTTTFTVTGAGAFVISKNKSDIKVSSFTIGKVIDFDFKDANNMGVAMAPAAFDTIKRHLSYNTESFNDYDLVITGDLSKLGIEFLKDLLTIEGIDYEGKLDDCGLKIYDIENQDVFCGGSGCGCSAVVSCAYIFKEMKKSNLNRVLLVSTGALLSPVAVQQKESIPCVAHAICFERSSS